MGTARVPNGSTLKQEISPTADFNDPLEVLSRVVGILLHEDDDSVNGAVEKPPELIKDIAFDGRSLEQFVDNASERDGERFDTDYFEHGFSVEECE